MKHLKLFEMHKPEEEEDSETFDEHKKRFSISDVMSMLPTSKEAENYANGNFGYPEDHDDDIRISASEEAFVSGCDWMRSEIERKLKGN